MEKFAEINRCISDIASLHGGSLEITLTVPLIRQKKIENNLDLKIKFKVLPEKVYYWVTKSL